jgi:membrane fusion protein (multidrug efflux system)
VEGTLLVALDVSVEEAELKALEAEAALAKTLLSRMERAVQSRATSQMEVDRARAQLDVAEAQTARFKAVIARKTIRAPFRARIGISDVHPGQYLNEGTLLTTLQGVDEAAHVDFAIPQAVAAQLQPGETVEILAGTEQPVVTAEIVALDARVNPVTRSTTVRARVNDADKVPAPGASVRVRVPASAPVVAVSVPVSALRKGPSGDHVFIIKPDDQGKLRAQLRPAQAGPVLGDQVLLLSGVGAGDQVAAHGSFKLRDKVLVAVTQTNSLAAN